MEIKKLLRDLRNLDVSDCTYDKFYDPETKCFCPLGKLAIKTKMDFTPSKYGYENSVAIISYLKDKYSVPLAEYSFFRSFMETFDKYMQWKKGRNYSMKKAIKSFEEDLKEKGYL